MNVITTATGHGMQYGDIFHTSDGHLYKVVHAYPTGVWAVQLTWLERLVWKGRSWATRVKGWFV